MDLTGLGFPLWLRLTHYTNALFIGLLIRSGIEILGAHPRLYWNDGCLVKNPLRLSMAELQSMPSQVQVTKHNCVQGWSGVGKWKGVRLADVLERILVGGTGRQGGSRRLLVLEELARVTRHAHSGQHEAVEANVAGDSPGEHQPGGQDKQHRIGAERACQ
jgi:hypothetical protein